VRIVITDTSNQWFSSPGNETSADWIFHHHAKTPHGFAFSTRIGPPGLLYEPADRRSMMIMLN